MASINGVSEDDFTALAFAAQRAKDAGRESEAEALDKMARKASASLTNAKYADIAVFAPGYTPMTWKRVPSTLI